MFTLPRMKHKNISNTMNRNVDQNTLTDQESNNPVFTCHCMHKRCICQHEDSFRKSGQKGVFDLEDSEDIRSFDDDLPEECQCEYGNCTCDPLRDDSEDDSINESENNFEDDFGDNFGSESDVEGDFDLNDHNLDPEYVSIISKLSPPDKIPIFRSRTNVDEVKPAGYNDVLFTTDNLIYELKNIKKKIKSFLTYYEKLPSITDVDQLCEYSADEDEMSLPQIKDMVETLHIMATTIVKEIKTIQTKMVKIREIEGRSSSRPKSVFSKSTTITATVLDMFQDLKDYNTKSWIDLLARYMSVIKERETYFFNSFKKQAREREVELKKIAFDAKKAAKLAASEVNKLHAKSKKVVNPIIRDNAFVGAVNSSRREWLKCVVEIDRGIDLNPTIRQYSKFKPCHWWTEELADFYYELYNKEIDFGQAIVFMSQYAFPINVMDYAIEATFMAIIKAFIISCYRFDTNSNLHYFRYGNQWKMKTKFPVSYNVGIKRENINVRKYFVARSYLYDYIMDTGHDFYGVQCICAPELPPTYNNIAAPYNNIATPYKWLKTETSDASSLLLALANTFGQKGAYKLVSLFTNKGILAISCKTETRNNLIKLLKEFYDNYCIECDIDKILNNTTLCTFHSRMIYFVRDRIRDESKYDSLINYVNSSETETLVDQESVIRSQNASVIIFCTKINKDDIDIITEITPFNITNFTTSCKDLFRLSKQVNEFIVSGIDLVIPCTKTVNVLSTKERFIQEHIEVFDYFKWSEFNGSATFPEGDVIITPLYYIINGIKAVNRAFSPDHKATKEEIEENVIGPLNEYFNMSGDKITYHDSTHRKSIRINKISKLVSGIVIPRLESRVVPIPRT